MRRLAAVTITALAASLSATAQAGADGLPIAPVKGSTDFCLTPEAVEHLGDSGITMYATGAAAFDHAKPNCVKFPVAENALSLDGTPFDGGFGFARGGRRLDFSHLFNHVTDRSVTADVSVDGRPEGTIPFLAYASQPRHVPGAPSVMQGIGLLRLTASGKRAFTRVFGDSPVGEGQNLYAAAGRVDLIGTAKGATGPLLHH